MMDFPSSRVALPYLSRTVLRNVENIRNRFIYVFTQSYTTLDFIWKKIGDKGARNLAQVLQHNTVRQLVFLQTVYPPLPFDIDIHNAQTWEKQSRC